MLRLRETATVRIRSRQIRNNTHAGAGFDVQIFEAGEPLLSRICGDERIADYYANAMKQTPFAAATHWASR